VPRLYPSLVVPIANKLDSLMTAQHSQFIQVTGVLIILSPLLMNDYVV